MAFGKQLSDSISIAFKYSFESGIGIDLAEKCMQKISVSILATDYGDRQEPTEEIGQLTFFVFLMGEALNQHVNFYEVFDNYDQFVFENAMKVIDSETGDFFDAINSHYEGDLIGVEFCLFGSLKIIPKYRGYQIGAKLIKDVVFHYSSTCSLFVLKPFPLQFEGAGDNKIELTEDYYGFENDFNKATQKLIHYYSKLDFELVEGIKDLMFLNPSLQNKALDRLDL
jgi:GNAT superfamily N-acetyltransferase